MNPMFREKSKKEIKIALIASLILVFGVPIAKFLSSLLSVENFFILILSWGVLWYWFLSSKSSLTFRGITFIVFTVAIAVLGPDYLLDTEYSVKEIKVFTDTIVLIAGGVGGSFLARDIELSEAKTKP